MKARGGGKGKGREKRRKTKEEEEEEETRRGEKRKGEEERRKGKEKEEREVTTDNYHHSTKLYWKISRVCCHLQVCSMSNNANGNKRVIFFPV